MRRDGQGGGQVENAKKRKDLTFCDCQIVRDDHGSTSWVARRKKIALVSKWLAGTRLGGDVKGVKNTKFKI
jgi:hypothetical protein